ncbi:HAD-IIB family hydrolase [Fervidibacillus halotolerans]|uniref:HAD-IIB family hydrolase n=1 Tax=Fervidibacillus halotolerans TaxID=2980027 RepID=A0A9E8M294_9BACI|nr:HAD-IIB family hydrolase [Fervidibacillus halotolerans]WAA12999.1 HAD-IIB family hydrolase [Fervidibacillus halotolerans]
MIYRLLAMNIDGTVLQSNGKIDKSVKAAIDYVQEKGVTVTLMTGRNFSFAKRVAKALNIRSLIISHHGAFIASSIDQAIFVKRIGEETLFDIVQFLESFPCEIRLIHESFSIGNKPVKGRRLMARAVIDSNSFSVYQYRFVERLSRTIQEEHILPTHLVTIFEEKYHAEEVKAAIRGMFDDVEVKTYGKKMIILPKNISKLSGLLYVADYWNISLKETVAIGSGMDDLDVLIASGLGVAMGNAPDELRGRADWVTRTNDSHGIYYMVKELFRKQQPLPFLEKIQGVKK